MNELTDLHNILSKALYDLLIIKCDIWFNQGLELSFMDDILLDRIEDEENILRKNINSIHRMQNII